ncbi:hypothetical protein [Virgibacillus halodenitrificans]|uniref:Uncharacterized protein n=1 Tax=Virgibacillus halodenitrificans TaxID=1482 RepID=A0ABR7VRQ9_VIRHA|nr:hypothetical protein [Virgibacillus halodenitrificans]MBD1224333.1 hypothetical protein [Virgibacillus halodenitrificans]
MKRLNGLFIVCLSLIILIGFDNKQNLIIANIKVDVKDNLLRYEVILKTENGSPIKSNFDYQGHIIQGFELAVKPNKPLEELMELDKTSKFTKMLPDAAGTSSGSQDELLLFVEYIIKDDSNLKEVEKVAINEATLFIFDGANKIKELPLSGQ